MTLKNDSELIRKYKKAHSPEHFWKEIGQGIRSVGILEMEIYLSGNQLFMIVETPLDFDWDSAMAKLATLPRRLPTVQSNRHFKRQMENDGAHFPHIRLKP